MSFSLNLDSLQVASFATVATGTHTLAAGTTIKDIFCCTGCDSGCGINPTASGCDSGGDANQLGHISMAEPVRHEPGVAVAVAAAK